MSNEFVQSKPHENICAKCTKMWPEKKCNFVSLSWTIGINMARFCPNGQRILFNLYWAANCQAGLTCQKHSLCQYNYIWSHLIALWTSWNTWQGVWNLWRTLGVNSLDWVSKDLTQDLCGGIRSADCGGGFCWSTK